MPGMVQGLTVDVSQGPMFMHYNAVLRRFPQHILETTRGNTYVTTIHCINSAILKLSRASPLTPRSAWRGSNKMRLPLEFAAKNHLGRQGIVEMGFLSLTTSRQMALSYSEGDALSTVLKIARGDLSSGALVAPLSFYILEVHPARPPQARLAPATARSRGQSCPLSARSRGQRRVRGQRRHACRSTSLQAPRKLLLVISVSA